MIDDFSTTFPEYSGLLNKWNRANFADELTVIDELFEYCLRRIPHAFFNILYQNADTFGDETVNTHFLPDIDFKNIINDETLSEKTKQIIWKYLQLILFTVIGTIKEKDEFGDYEKMFADVNPKELQEKNQRNHIEHDGVLRVRRRRNRNRNGRTRRNPPTPTQVIYRTDELNDHLSGLFRVKSARSQRTG
jgi:hypothetical protein